MPPSRAQTIADLAREQAGQQAFDQARETLRAGLEADAGQPLLWLTLGQVLSAEGRHPQAAIFFEEALRLDPDSAATRAALAEALLLGAGDTARAQEFGEQALAAASPEDLPALTAGQARRELAAGRLAQGWTLFAAGAEPGDAQTIEVRVAAPRWTPGMALNGRLVLIGEEGLADELLLAHAVPDIIASGLPPILAVNACWERLARRSFPGAMVAPLLSRAHESRCQLAAELDNPHVHENELVGAWAPLRAMMPLHRGALADFTEAGPYLTPDKARIALWRSRLAESGSGLKVGLAWRTPERDGMKAWETPLVSWLAGPLSTTGIRLIGLEQQEVVGEIDFIREAFGLRIETPPDVNREDLDDFAAVACAMDVVIGPPDAMTFLAAACGARTWFLSPPGHWAMLGCEGFPWFPNARVIRAAAGDNWTDAAAELGQALADLSARG